MDLHVQGDGKSPFGLFGAVILDDFRDQITLLVIEQADNGPVKTDGFDYLIQDLPQDFIQSGLIVYTGADPEYALQQFSLSSIGRTVTAGGFVVLVIRAGIVPILSRGVAE